MDTLQCTLLKENITITKDNYYDVISLNYDDNYNDYVSLAENDIIKDITLNNIKSNENINMLDLGCGTGLMYELFNDKIGDYLGVDISEGMLDKFKMKHGGNINLINQDVNSINLLNLKNNHYDIIISTFGSFSYINNVEQFLSSIKKKLKENGIFLLMTYSRYSSKNIINSYLTKNSSFLEEKRSYNFRNDGIGFNGPLANFYTKNELLTLSSNAGFNNAKVIGLNYFADFYKDQFSSEKQAKEYLLNEIENIKNPDLAHSLILILNNYE